MKKLITAFLLTSFLTGFSQEVPKILKTKFSKEALAQKVTDVNGNTVTISKILKDHRGKILVIDLWASWCRDCLNAMPKAKELEANNPKVDFVFLSLDRNFDAWKKGLEKHEMQDRKSVV